MKINAPREHDIDCNRSLPSICAKCVADSVSDEEWNRRFVELYELGAKIEKLLEKDIK